MPWANTLSATVTVMTVTNVDVCGSPAASTITTPKTIDARPRGPNHPRKRTVGARACEPSIATTTGTIRTTVRLSTAYTTSARPTCAQTEPSTAAPNTMKVTPLNNPANSSENAAGSASRPANLP